MGALNFSVSDIIHFRNIFMPRCSFSTALLASHKISFPSALMSGCPRCTSGRNRRDRTAGSARLVFPTEQKHALAAGAEERADRGASKLRNVWSLLLKNIRQPSNRIAQCSACVVCSVCERDRMWGTTTGIRWGESLEKRFRK